MILMHKAPRPLGAVTIHPLERWRLAQKMTQGQVGDAVGCSNDVIHRAESGIAIRPKIRDRLIELSRNVLKVSDFTPNARERTKVNGSSGKGTKVKRRKKVQR